MVDCGTTTITDPEEYRARLPCTSISLVLGGRGEFKARITWVNLRRLGIIRIEEKVPRVAFLAPSPGSIFVTFPIRTQLPLVWGGVEIQPREMVLHSLGDRFHQRSAGPCRWGMISLSPKYLAVYGRALTHLELKAPRATAFLRPASPFRTNLLRLHAHACRLAETKPDTLAQKEVAHALEQDVLNALVSCLTAPVVRRDSGGRQRRAEIMARFEDVLAKHCYQHPPMREVYEAVGVSERVLRICCAQFLRLSPLNYKRLRRLNLARSALRRAEPATVTVAEVARQYGFTELGRFAVAYRAVFGETPSSTLRSELNIRDPAFELSKRTMALQKKIQRLPNLHSGQ